MDGEYATAFWQDSDETVESAVMDAVADLQRNIQ